MKTQGSTKKAIDTLDNPKFSKYLNILNISKTYKYPKRYSDISAISEPNKIDSF